MRETLRVVRRCKRPLRKHVWQISCGSHTRFSHLKYVYDGLLHVVDMWQERGPTGKLIYKFKLVRILSGGCPSSSRYTPANNYDNTSDISALMIVPPGRKEIVCAQDISGGREKLPIRAVNSVDIEEPPSFNYIVEMIYPAAEQSKFGSRCCDCIGGGGCENGRNSCSSSGNGGGWDIVFNPGGCIQRASLDAALCVSAPRIAIIELASRA
ncbi:hypothetical protein CRG98_025071 [Punica granatum]|uniref:YDG domain-containing protein n=2 Tax=Punica granatum TaxID=22663 RepID=A0A2I0JE98_PUNGR|nr:hypothetical protein CRG98_025071 [Punica granatum]